ncbi:hypothetical protein TYRP_005398, partial [Tyrophagus putrescentiae]
KTQKVWNVVFCFGRCFAGFGSCAQARDAIAAAAALDKTVRSRCRSRNARCYRCSELAGKHCWCGGSTAQNGENHSAFETKSWDFGCSLSLPFLLWAAGEAPLLQGKQCTAQGGEF